MTKGRPNQAVELTHTGLRLVLVAHLRRSSASCRREIRAPKSGLALQPFFTNVGGSMEELTCPNCNCDVGSEELKRNNLHCPTCGFDMSDAEDMEDLDKDEDLEEEDEDEDEEEEDEEE